MDLKELLIIVAALVLALRGGGQQAGNLQRAGANATCPLEEIDRPPACAFVLATCLL
jgi:hypothetical protein